MNACGGRGSSKVWVGLALLLWGTTSDARATPQELAGRWFDASASPAVTAAKDLDEAGLTEIPGPARTGGTYRYISALSVDTDGRYIIDFKNSSTIGRFEHLILDERGVAIARMAGGIQSDAFNPYFMRHAREVWLKAGRYRLISTLRSPFFLGEPEPFMDTIASYQQAIKLGNAIVLLCLGVFIGLGTYYTALSFVRRRVADAAYASFILGNLLYNGTALLLLPDLFGMHWFYLVSLPILFSNCAYIVFVLALLEIRPETHRKLYGAGRSILGLFVGFMVVAWLRPNWSLELDRYGVGIFAAFGLIAAWIRAREGNPTARLYLVAIGTFFVLGMLAISLSRVVSFTLYVEHLGLFAVVVEVVLLALVLAHQFALLSREKDTALAAAAAGARLKATLDALPDSLFELDGAGRITALHTPAGAEPSFSPGQAVIGRTVAEALPPAAAGVIEAALQHAREHGVHKGSTYSLHRVDDERWFELSIARKGPPHGAESEFVAISRDVTELKQAALERLEHERKLQHTQKLESLGILAGGIAHDFNNLLTGILGNVELAHRLQPAGSRVRVYLDAAIQGALRAADLATQMLAYSGKGRFVVAPVDLSSLIEETTLLLQASVSKQCTIRYALMKDLPSVEADATQLRQVIMNLIINASEAIGENGGVITASTGAMHCDRAYLDATARGEDAVEGTYAYLEVTDNGCGMSQATRAKLFDPFFTTKFTGRGLGLSVVQGIVRGHRGAIRVSSETGSGTTVRVLLPTSTRPFARPARKEAAPDQGWVGSGTVLIVDDEAPVREVARTMFEMLGFGVVTAADGREGVDVFRADPARIRLVLLDMTMPRLNGIGALQEMLAIRGDIPVVLTSGYDEQTATRGATEESWAGFLQKPFCHTDLERVVRRVLSVSLSE